MKRLTHILLLIFAAWLLSGCAITHEYGPYMGKVVEKESGEPIEGAVVFVKFSTITGNIGGHATHYADAVETLTGPEGEFIIPPYRINTFRFLHGWDKHPSMITFKPGFGAFPRHHDTEPQLDYGIIPEHEHVTIKLPELETREERKKNLRNISFTSNIPYEKWQHLFEYRNIENIQVGLTPYHIPDKKEQ